MAMKPKKLIKSSKSWKIHWQGMPEFKVVDQKPYRSIVVCFDKKEYMDKFSNLIGQKILETTKSIWYPEVEIRPYVDKRYIVNNNTCLDSINPKYPVYIISKGRWESRFTSKWLEKLNIPYHIVIEPQEYDQYSNVIDKNKICVLPFSNLGQGSIPARNWVWEDSIKRGFDRHWILDDNLNGFYRFNNNLKVPVGDGVIFRCAEDFSDRYNNVALSGFQYFMFIIRKDIYPPFYPNTRVYSCILIKNDIPYRWRGRYNEDTDLSIRVLKDGWCTILFNTFLADKVTTMSMKGGNTDELYIQNKEFDGRYEMAKSLRDQHPDIVKITRKWGRWQHTVNYEPFKRNKLVFKKDIDILKEVNNYGMKLINIEE